jgi:predicted RNA-binding protein YlqC (UPF0109 family)
MCDSKTAQVHEMLLSVVRSLVDHPEEIKVSIITEETGTLFQVRSCPRDIGKLIGSKGRTAKALRIILAANAMRLKRNFRLDIDSLESTAISEPPYGLSATPVDRVSGRSPVQI